MCWDFHYRANLIAVDPFMGGYDDMDGTSQSLKNDAEASGLTLFEASEAWGLAMAFDLKEKIGCRYHLLRTKSVAGASAFSDGSVDVVFIDGLHKWEFVQ